MEKQIVRVLRAVENGLNYSFEVEEETGIRGAGAYLSQLAAEGLIVRSRLRAFRPENHKTNYFHKYEPVGGQK